MDTNILSNIIWRIFLDAWWFWLSLLAVFIVLEVIKVKKSAKRFGKISEKHSGVNLLNKLRSLSSNEFEEYIAFLFKKLGYKSEVVGKSHDGGVDVIIEKDGLKQYIQCKKYNSRNKATLHDVRDFYGSLVDFLANSKGYFITTGSFTLEAEEFAKDKPIELVDGFKLLEYIKMASVDNKEYFDNKNEEKCPKCDGVLIEKRSKYGKFLGCSNYPKCRFTRSLK